MDRYRPSTTRHRLPRGVRIPSIAALNDAIAAGNDDFALLLNGGFLFSRKTITRERGKYRVWHHITDTVEVISARELLDTNIGHAMNVGALVTLD